MTHEGWIQYYGEGGPILIPRATVDGGGGVCPTCGAHTTPLADTKIVSRSLSEKLVALLCATPGKPIRELAAALYDIDTEHNRSKVRALLSQLARFNKVHRAGAGRWEAT